LSIRAVHLNNAESLARPPAAMEFNAATNKTVLNRYLALKQPDNITQCMYVWIDGTGENLRAKTKTVKFVPGKPAELPVWNYDGSSTGQAEGKNSDTYLTPVAMYADPFRGGNNKLVLCETFKYDNTPTETNKRGECEIIMERAKEQHPWFGIEQEYAILEQDQHPFGWPKSGYPGPQGPYYCGVGANKVYGRDVKEAHYKACLNAGVNISGTNVENMPAQMEFQVGPCEGITMGDDLWMARFLLHRVAEEFGIVASIDPKPVMGDWSGSGAHCNFSTEAMRQPGGMAEIEAAIKLLEDNHDAHIKVYDPNEGKDNERRLTGLHETHSLYSFSSGVADRGSSVRIPRDVAEMGYGYLEDRRPSSNSDPYTVTGMIVKTVCLKE